MEATQGVRYVGYREAEEITGMKARTLRGKLPPDQFYRIGPKKTLFRVDRLIAWLELYRCRPDADLDELVDGVVADVLRES